MKAIATLALISLAYASEDNELFKFDNTRVVSHRNQTRAEHIRPHPIHHNGAHNVTVKPKPLKPVRPVFFNRTQTAQSNDRTRHFDDDELMSKKLQQFILANPHLLPPPQQTAPGEGANPGLVVPPKKKSGGPGKWIGRNKEWIAPIGGKILDKIFEKLDDEELFAIEELPENELAAQGPTKWINRNKEWIAPVAGKILDKVLSKLDDDQLFFDGEVADNELMSKKLKNFILMNPHLLPPPPAQKPVQHAVPVASANPEQGAPEQAAPEQAAPVLPPKKKKGGPGKWIGRNKEWIAPIGGKILDKIFEKLDDEELFAIEELPENELAAQGPTKWINRNKEWIAPVAGKILDKVLSKLDAEDFTDDELHFLGVVGKETGKFFKHNGKTIASVGMKVLPALLLDEEDDELFNLGGLVKDGLNIYGDIKTKNYGGLVSHGIQTVKDIKKHDDDGDDELFLAADNELMSKKYKQFLAANPHLAPATGRNPQQTAPVASTNTEQAAPEQAAPEQTAPAHKKKKGFFAKNGKTIAGIGMKILPALLLDEEENELFNLGGLIKDGLNIYGDIKTKNYGGLVNHGIQTVKDIKKHDDDELFNVKPVQHKGFLGAI